MSNPSEFPNMISRVVALQKDSNNPYEDPVEKLAIKEDEFRNELNSHNIDPKLVDKLADRFSTETLEKMEAEKTGHLDLLTGFSNKNSMIENLPKILSAEQRKQKNCSLIMLDLDHFKSVNDTYGHEIGDLVLKSISNIIKQSLRASDFPFRYGGEEFVIFLMDSDVDTAKIVAEKIRKAIEDVEIKFKDENNQEIILKKTISIGCVDTNNIDSWSVNDKDFDSKLVMKELIAQADKALYIAKNTGRNKIEIYSNEVK